MGHWIVLVVIGIMLIVGVTAAVIWWTMADVLFPGTSRKTGQTILGRGGAKKKPEGPPPGATVVKDFDQGKP